MNDGLRTAAKALGIDVEAESAEFGEVFARYVNTPQWMKAPNGKPSHLTVRQWIQVRTPAFKKKAGDWEAVAELQGYNLSEAKKKLKELVKSGREVITLDGTTLIFSSQAKKAWSKAAKQESDNPAAHWTAVGNLESLCGRSTKLWEEEPRNDSVDIRAYVKYGAMFSYNGNQYLAKITAKSYPNKAKQNFYSIEAVSVVKIRVHGMHKAIAKGQPLDVDATITISQLLNSVNSVTMVLDENGEPKFVQEGQFHE